MREPLNTDHAAFLSKRGTLRAIVRGAYDIQKLRIQAGNRLVTNFKARLGQLAGMPEGELSAEAKEVLEVMRGKNPLLASTVASAVDEETEGDEEAEPDAKLGKAMIKAVIATYGRLTDKKKRLPTKDQFKGDVVISDYTEFALAAQYMELLTQEKSHFTRLGSILLDFPIYEQYLQHVRGIGPAMAGVLVSEFDIFTGRHPSSFWAYAGLDVGPDGRGRSKRKEHLVQRPYTDAEGKEQMKDSITYNPFLKTKLFVLATSFLRVKGSTWKEVYGDHKHRLESHEVVGKHNDGVKNAEGKIITSPGLRHMRAMRYMIKMFLLDLHINWRRIAGLPVSVPYQEAKLGHQHGRSA